MDELKQKRRRIRDLMRYATPDQQLDAALDLLTLYRDDRMALTVLNEFYSYLPDAQEDWVKELRLVGRQAGVFLLAAVTSSDAYLYLISSEGIEFHGSLKEGYLDKELLKFFKFASAEKFSGTAQNYENFLIYEPLQVDVDICPACHAATGEPHELGCPVEVCPWCGGQLIHCECRFAQLDLEEMNNEQDVLRFEALLNEKGRVVYAPEQRPFFADEGGGVEVL